MNRTKGGAKRLSDLLKPVAKFPRDPAPRSFHQPVLTLTHDVKPGEEPDYIPRLTRVLRLSTATGYRLTVPGAAHLTFTEAPLYLPPLPALVGSLGRTAGRGSPRRPPPPSWTPHSAASLATWPRPYPGTAT
ncbi:hypothetical protein [Streptosporangium sp. NPDC002607]